ncbi:MAG: UDP-N-acetylmuramoyl-tripeptide--D-alanyl-D-alanine ligase [bacterium]|nr:UDP-N-acetylmuramoyl-tripeptide--D-alanyl-D-alanine ligase [bacterium]
MNTVFLLVLLLIWWAGTSIRAYKQARFYQIEEYKMGRYARWWMKARDRLFPMRPITLTAIGLVMIFIFSESPDSPFPLIIGIVLALIANIPPDEGEIKKQFRHTPRANRLLGATIVWISIAFLLIITILGALAIESERYQALLAMMIGLVAHLLAPIFLVLGNIAMMPVEAFLRGRFIASAKRVMKQINPTVIGITGSYGKTTTKVFLTEILNGRYKAYPTPKSFNTMMGVCIAINNDLKNDLSIDYFVVEMGAYIRGEIQRICKLTPPHISIVVEVGPQHLERFGSLENIATAKYEIIKELPPDGVGVFNWDNPYVRAMAEKGYPKTRLLVSKTVSPSDPKGVRFVASDMSESLNGLSFTVTDTEKGDSARFETPLLGEHNVTNILLSTAVAVHEGMSLRDVAMRVRSLRPAESRLVRQVMSGITIINDAYSANPAGVVSALKVLSLHTGKKLVVTPGMVELGQLHYPENYKLGELLKDHATDVILVGAEQTKPIFDGLKASGFPDDRLLVVDELREAITWYQTHLTAGDTVLFLNDLPDTY